MLPKFTAENALRESRRYRSSFGGNPQPRAASITPAQSCHTICGPGNSTITVVVPFELSSSTIPMPVTQSCGWGLFPYIKICDGVFAGQGCASFLDPFAHCDRYVPADPPPPPPPPPEDCTTRGCKNGLVCCDCTSPARCTTDAHCKELCRK